MTAMKWKEKHMLLTSVILALILILSLPSDFHAASPKKKLSQIEKQIKSKKRKVKQALKNEESILTRIQSIEKNIYKKEKELKEYKKRLSTAEAETLLLEREISRLDKKLVKRKKLLRERLKSLYKQQYGGSTLILISATDYNDLIRRSKYISLIAYNDNRIMVEYTSDIEKLNIKIKTFELLKKKLETSRTNAKKKKKELQHNRVRKDKLLVTIRSKRSSYEKAIKELNKSSKKLRQLIKKFEKKKIPKSVLGKGFRSWKGRLPWPVKGTVIVPFGKYKDPKFNITVFKNGIEIKAKEGYRPQAVAGGQVVYADWFKGYGQLMIINHGSGYHSLYGNLTEIFHKTGDIIKSGTSIGKTGKSELLNVPSLYFEIRYKGKPVNPMKWLKRKRKR
jgi:septal ring factor EnvC (AmiA/AmiB activator)